MGRPAASALVQPSGRRELDACPRSRRCPPSSAPDLGRREQLVEPAGILVDHQDVCVRATLDERRGQDRIADVVGLVVVLEGDRGSVASWRSQSGTGCRSRQRAEVHVQAAFQADGADHRLPSPTPRGARRCAGSRRCRPGRPGSPAHREGRRATGCGGRCGRGGRGRGRRRGRRGRWRGRGVGGCVRGRRRRRRAAPAWASVSAPAERCSSIRVARRVQGVVPASPRRHPGPIAIGVRLAGVGPEVLLLPVGQPVAIRILLAVTSTVAIGVLAQGAGAGPEVGPVPEGVPVRVLTVIVLPVVVRVGSSGMRANDVSWRFVRPS